MRLVPLFDAQAALTIELCLAAALVQQNCRINNARSKLLGMQLQSQMQTTSAVPQPSHIKRSDLVATHSHAGEHEAHSFSHS